MSMLYDELPELHPRLKVMAKELQQKAQGVPAKWSRTKEGKRRPAPRSSNVAAILQLAIAVSDIESRLESMEEKASKALETANRLTLVDVTTVSSLANRVRTLEGRMR